MPSVEIRRQLLNPQFCTGKDGAPEMKGARDLGLCEKSKSCIEEKG